MIMKNVLITGANGFIGKSITLKLENQEGYKVRAACSKNMQSISAIC